MPDKRTLFLLRRGSLAALLAVSCLGAQAGQHRPGMVLKPGLPRAEKHESKREIDELEKAWRDAVLHHNVQALDGLLADDYIAITSDGRLISKEETLANLRSGTLQFKEINFSDRKVRFYGKTALVTSRADVRGKMPDKDISGSYRYTRVYVMDLKGKWRIVSFETSAIR